MDGKGASLLTVNVANLLEFFDEIPPGSGKHATAIVAVAGEDLGSGLLKALLQGNKEAEVTILHDADNRPLSVTTGNLRGPRLDRWVQVAWPDGTLTLFQSEIKNWSAHAFRGSTLKLTASSDEVSKRMKQEWEGVRGELGGTLNAINKVLVPMARPPQAHPSAHLEPLLICWSVMHPEGLKEESFFWHPLSEHDHPTDVERKFNRLAVFSMSTYLRVLLAHDIGRVQLWMPEASARMHWLNTLFTS